MSEGPATYEIANIAEAMRQAKAKLESDLTAVLEGFTAATSLTVSDLALHLERDVGNTPRYRVAARIKLE